MVEVSLIKLPSWNCLQINVTGTYWKKNPTLVQVHLMTWRLYYTVVQSDSGCRPVGNQSAISLGAIGNRLAIGRRLYLWRLFLIAESLQLFGDRSATDRRLVGDQSATKNCVGIVCNRCNRSVANQWATSRQPVGDHQKPFYDRFGRREASLAATKTSLRPNRPCNLLQPPTSRRPPCNLPATTRNFGRKEVADRLQAMCDRGSHWGRVTHICVGKLIIVGSDNDLSPDRRQGIIWLYAGLLSIGLLRTYFSENLIQTQQFSLKEMHVKMSSAKWRSSCLGLNVLTAFVSGRPKLSFSDYRGPFY